MLSLFFGWWSHIFCVGNEIPLLKRYFTHRKNVGEIPYHIFECEMKISFISIDSESKNMEDLK